MSKYKKLLMRILSGTADSNISFSDLCEMMRRLGFDERIRGSHHIFTREGVAEILNFQPKAGRAKPYQVRQTRNLITRYRLGESDR